MDTITGRAGRCTYYIDEFGNHTPQGFVPTSMEVQIYDERQQMVAAYEIRDVAEGLRRASDFGPVERPQEPETPEDRAALVDMVRWMVGETKPKSE